MLVVLSLFLAPRACSLRCSKMGMNRQALWFGLLTGYSPFSSENRNVRTLIFIARRVLMNSCILGIIPLAIGRR
jgi:hypothetical protein